MKRLIILACCLLGLAGQLATAAERRVALVIGNNNYQNLPALQKAVNDANAVAAELKKIGFEVASYNDIGQKKMNQAINEFAQNVSGGGIGVFFYAGHGVQIDNQNYLIPVDMDSPKDAADVGDQAISIPRLQDKLADAKARYTLLVLDACRNNPLPKKAGRSIGHTRGLAMTHSPSGQTVLYSAGANQEALDALDEMVEYKKIHAPVSGCFGVGAEAFPERVVVFVEPGLGFFPLVGFGLPFNHQALVDIHPDAFGALYPKSQRVGAWQSGIV